MALSFTINNISSSSLTYQGQTITAGGNYTPPAPGTNFATDYSLYTDIISGNITITVGTNTYAYEKAGQILQYIALLPALGTSGSSVPTFIDLVGGKDGSGNLQPVRTDTSGNLYANQSGTWATQSAPTDGTKISYSAAAVGFIPPAAATDIFTITGSATKTIRITRIACTISTTAGSGIAVNFTAIKRSTANTGGTSSIISIAPHDSTNAAATAVVRSYTANPTLGTTVATVRSQRAYAGTAGSSQVDIVWTFGDRPSQAMVLRGTSEVLSINISGVTITNPVACANVEWTEE